MGDECSERHESLNRRWIVRLNMAVSNVLGLKSIFIQLDLVHGKYVPALSAV